MFRKDLGDDALFMRKMITIVVVFIITSIFIMIISIYMLVNNYETTSTQTQSSTLEEKTIKEEDYGYSFTAPILNPISTYFVGDDIEPGIYDIYYSESKQGSGNMTISKNLERENCIQNCESTSIYISNEQYNDGMVYNNLVIYEGDRVVVNLSDSGEYRMERQENISDFDSEVNGTYSVDKGVYELSIFDVDLLSNPEDLYLETYEYDDIHRYYITQEGDELYFVHDLVDDETGFVEVIYETKVEDYLKVELILYDKNYIYYNKDEMNNNYKLEYIKEIK